MPVLGASSEPRIGNHWFSFVGHNATSKSVGVLAIALAPGNFQILGITVLVDVTNPTTGFINVASDTRGELALPLPLPNDSSIVGLTVYSQIAWSDNCTPSRVSATQGLRVRITQ